MSGFITPGWRIFLTGSKIQTQKFPAKLIPNFRQDSLRRNENGNVYSIQFNPTHVFICLHSKVHSTAIWKHKWPISIELSYSTKNIFWQRHSLRDTKNSNKLFSWKIAYRSICGHFAGLFSFVGSSKDRPSENESNSVWRRHWIWSW